MRRQRFVILMGRAQDSSERAVAKAIEVIERHRMTPLAQRRFQSRRAIFRLVDKRALQIDVAERAMAACEIRIGVDRALEIGFGRVEPRRGKPPEIPQAALVAIPGVQAFRRLAGGELLLDLRQLRLDRCGDLACHLLLDIEDIFELQVVFVGPQLLAIRSPDELRRYPHRVAALANAADHHVSHAKLLADFAGIHGSSLETRSSSVAR